MAKNALETLEDIKERLGIDTPVSLQSHISVIAEDSLELLEHIMLLEDWYDINITSPEKFETVSDLIEFIVSENQKCA